MVDCGHLGYGRGFLAREEHFEQLLLGERVQLLEVRHQVLHGHLLSVIIWLAFAWSLG